MKNILFLSLTVFLLSCGSSPATPSEEYQIILASSHSDPVLKNIQKKINNAFASSMAGGDSKKLETIEKQLKNLYQQKPQKLILYWRAYLSFYRSIFHLQKEDKRKAEKAVDQGIEWLLSMDKMNSEDHALLSMLQGFSIQFKAGIKAPFIGNKAENNGSQATTLDSLNLRGWYVSASSDFYTPEKYGGGTKAEQFLLKALTCPDQKVKNEYLPSWGREEVYEMLIKFYIRKKNWEAAKLKFSEANEIFPNSYLITQLATKLVGK